MLDFFSMEGTYAERAVDRFETDGVIIDTCAVTDSDQPYETAVSHPKYNGGAWVIVEMYESREDAQVGHDRWVSTMTASKLPPSLRDVSAAGIAKMAGGDREYALVDEA